MVIDADDPAAGLVGDPGSGEDALGLGEAAPIPANTAGRDARLITMGTICTGDELLGGSSSLPLLCPRES